MTEYVTFSRETGFNIVEAVDEQTAEMKVGYDEGFVLDTVDEMPGVILAEIRRLLSADKPDLFGELRQLLLGRDLREHPHCPSYVQGEWGTTMLSSDDKMIILKVDEMPDEEVFEEFEEDKK